MSEDEAFLRRSAAAFRAAELLVEAYRRAAEEGGSIEWSDVDEAYVAAREALDLPESE